MKKTAISLVIAAGLAALSLSGLAQVRATKDGPEFVLNVPLDLQNMPVEIRLVRVHCQVLNATYRWDPKSGPNPQDAKLLQYRGNPQVVAEGDTAFLVFAKERWNLHRLVNDPKSPASHPGMNAEIRPAGNSVSRIDPNLIPVLPVRANTKSFVDPALGGAYGCRIEFETGGGVPSKGMGSGSLKEMTVFGLDPNNSYHGMPFTGKPEEGKVIYVFGNIGPETAGQAKPR